MKETMRKRDRLIYGTVLPIGVMVTGLFLIMLADTGAAAAEFAALGIMLGAIIVSPIVLVVNLVLSFQGGATRAECFQRGMIAPGIVLIGAIIYQTGAWDAIS